MVIATVTTRATPNLFTYNVTFVIALIKLEDTVMELELSFLVAVIKKFGH